MPRSQFPALLTAAASVLTAQPAYAAQLGGPSSTRIMASTELAVPAAQNRVAFEDIWRAPTVYKTNTGIVDEVRIVGRFHLDAYGLESTAGDRSDLVIRRTRLGFRAKFVGNLEAHVEGDFNLEGGGPLYLRLTDAYLAWKFSDAANLTVGKQSTEFTLDGSTSSNRLLTIDRSNINNNFGVPEEYIPGVSVGGSYSEWVYKVGVYTGGANDGEFGDFKGGKAVIATLGRDIGAALGVKKAVVRIDYFYNEPNVSSSFFRSFKNVGSLNLVLDDGPWGLSAEAVAADGSLGQSDGQAISALPWLKITEKLQLVARLTHIRSNQINGLRFLRYESVVMPGRGNRYDELYGGLNYYLYGHSLKLQSGLTYAYMQDRANDGGAYEGVTWTTALRLNW